MNTRAQTKVRALPARLLLAALFLFLVVPVATRAESQYNFELLGQALSESLIQFSHQSGLAIVFSDALTRGIQSPTVSGSMTPSEALAELLAGTELTWRLIDNRIIAIYDGSCQATDSCPDSTELLVMNPLYVPGIEELFVYGT